jgi:mono/diheme cytochrome c family protein/type 1 glutamine amidotransferase
VSGSLRFALAFSLLLAGAARGAESCVTYDGFDGPGRGKTIVLVSGDEEYRSEEALPQLGKILAVRHGFTCRVVFAIDPETGAINPDNRRNIPGLEALADADLMIIATRFRDLPDEQMAHIDRYVRSGRPIIGLRTATHAFALESSPTYARYSWNHGGEDYPQGFGRQVLGETWVAHHGAHGTESTRGVIAPAAADHPIVRGIGPGEIWGPTDVYSVRLPLPDGCTPIVLGQVLAGMSPDDPPVEGAKNEPMMPVSWTRTRADRGEGSGRVFTTTMGAATDLSAAGTRRMLVNAAYWALGMEGRIPGEGTDVRIVGTYEPTDYAFGGYRRGLRPRDHALQAPPSAGAALRPDDHVLVIGNTFAERLAQSGYFDAVAHAAHPAHRLTIRHVPWSADEVGLRPREKDVPTMEDWAQRLEPDVIFMCFGMSESMSEAATASFAADLRALIASLREGAGGRGPRFVLVSPIAHEQLGPPWPDAATVDEHNRRLAVITSEMRQVAAAEGATFVDLFTPSRAAYERSSAPLTTNGIHPTERGCAAFMGSIGIQLGWVRDAEAGEAASVDALRARACDAHYYFRLRYRPTNTEYVWGRRKAPYGVVNFPPEMAQLDRMIAARDEAIWAMDKPAPGAVLARSVSAPDQWARTPTSEVLPADAWTPAPVEAKGTETSLGSLTIDEPDDFLASFSVPGGYVVECFASEQDFPELANPLAMAFDDRHRLWVLCTPTYPHLLPGARAECKLLILEDSNGDGRADTSTAFADDLYIPTGFAIDTDCVYVGQAPDLLRLTDTDGDDRADTREIVLSGFGMCDSHHQISAFEWDPSGAFLLNEGVFTMTNVETPYGTRRTSGAGVFRFDPRTQRLQILAHCYFNNPWGHAYGDYGESVLADASGGENFSFAHVILPFEYPKKPGRVGAFLNRGRPTAGCELIASRHFPDDVQDSFLVNQSIGFHGTRWDRLTPEGSHWKTESMPQDLLASTDTNFRPVAMEVGPDGALYIVDWCNPIVGHMQYSVRDPRRDHTHGRVWRVRHADRPLVQPPNVHGATIAELLELLRLPERNTRQLARRRLQTMETARVLPALAAWLGNVDPADPLYDRLVLEDLWIRLAHGRCDLDLIERGLSLGEARARAGAVRVLRYMLQAGNVDTGGAGSLLERAVDDLDMRVRLEGVVACGFLPETDGIAIAARADLAEMDDAMHNVFGEVLAYLGRNGAGGSDIVERVRLQRLPADELLAGELTELSAAVRLSRADLSLEQRDEALTHLAGADDDARAARLVTALVTTRGDESIAAVGELLLAQPDTALNGVAEDARSIAAESRGPRQAVGAAVLIRTAGADGAPRNPTALVEAIGMMRPGDVPPPLLERVRDAVGSSAVDPSAGIAQLVRHDEQSPGLFEWLDGLVESVEGEGLDPWTPRHERAMAALRGLHDLDYWIDEGNRITVAAPEQMARGAELYADEAVGCARCHGARGQGLEGFPPLDRSPWVLGDPRRAASIVVHGLYGHLRMPDGRTFNSAMAPLGDNLDDEEVAAVLTYVRQSWGNFAEPVDAQVVAVARREAPPAGGMWSTDALIARHPTRRDGIVQAAAIAHSAPPTPWLFRFVRNLVVYLVPPLAMVAFILWRLDRQNTKAPA